MSKNVAFIFALPVRTYPILITMPFGLNIITLLDKKRYNIDIYLSEYRNTAYDNLFSENVKIHFIDENYLWRNNISIAYFMVTNYFRLISLFRLKNKYSLIFGAGMVGVTLGSILKNFNAKSKLIYLNDEFPDSSDELHGIWKNAEKNNALTADYVSTPDESRYVALCTQIPNLSKIKHYTLPNTPLLEDINELPSVNWHEYFSIPKDKKLFISAGGVGDLYQTGELLNSVSSWPKNVVLILKGKTNIEEYRKKYAHLDNQNVIWCSDSFSPDKLHSLIKYCSASICLYRNTSGNILYMGKSSGKIMRSLALGKPVIATDFGSLSFVKELNLGKLVAHPDEISRAIKYIIDNQKELESACSKNYKQISFEKYWGDFEHVIE